MKKLFSGLGILVLAALFLVFKLAAEPETASVSLSELPPFAGQPYVVLNDNEPDLAGIEDAAVSFERYHQMDGLGRCGPALASVGRDLMPTEARGSIGQVKPSGWQTAKYDSVDGKYLYNRCHLIGFQLTAENANEKNLITGTRYLNVQGMLPFENLVADYIKETGNHVLYRVTPEFESRELVARGVRMEALSVEDGGAGVRFHVFVYNSQPGITIDYATGESWENEAADTAATEHYILNTSGRRFHKPDCTSVREMKEENKQDYLGSRENLVAQGYKPCGNCKP